MRLEPGTFLGPSVPHPFLHGLSKNETYTRDRRNSFAYMEGRAFRHGDIVRTPTPPIVFQILNREIQITISFYTSPSPPEISTTNVQEDTLETLVKAGAGGFSLGSLIGKGSKFGGLDIKRVYFGYVLFWLPSRAPAP